jgi:hypothetical protein
VLWVMLSDEELEETLTIAEASVLLT